MEESSDEDIEIIATKENPNKILEVLQRYEETKRDLEEIEKNSILETRQHSPPDIQPLPYFDSPPRKLLSLLHRCCSNSCQTRCG